MTRTLSVALCGLCGSLAACGFDSPGLPPPGDGGPDGQLACAWTQLPAHFDPCEIPEPQGALILDMPGAYTYDTTAGTLTAPDTSLVDHAADVLENDNQESWLASVDALEILADVTLRVVGERPLVIASHDAIEIAAGATIDASSNKDGDGLRGAGANGAACNAGAALPGGIDEGGGAGGGGGAFQGSGGRGGDGNSDGAGSQGGAGGTAVEAPDFVRGGCDGASGGDGDPGTGGLGGAGGGAIQLSAQVRIEVAGTVHAGGAGARGAAVGDAGGGGGGSGGYIGLDAPTILIDGATLGANGGGGGEGSNNGQSGRAGDDATADDQAARGGSGGAGNATNGGDGSAGQDLGGESVGGVDQAGGDGGGGGAGFILVFGSPELEGEPVLSPPPIQR